jgi:hypothetical protein
MTETMKPPTNPGQWTPEITSAEDPGSISRTIGEERGKGSHPTPGSNVETRYLFLSPIGAGRKCARRLRYE